MLTIAGPLVGAATAVLALASCRNALETVSLRSKFAAELHNHHNSNNERSEQISTMLGVNQPNVLVASTAAVHGSIAEEENSTNPSIILRNLQSLSRHDLLQTFLASAPPTSLESIQGEWNGILLNNNAVLTTVTAFLTHALFGRGRTWNGKAFCFVPNKEDNGTKLGGVNRFQASTASSSSREKCTDTIETEHCFDYDISPSRLDSQQGGLSVNLVYNHYQGPLSPWKTMRDELRVLALPENSPIEVMICVGWMAWSGGVYNASPFCLWRVK